MLDNSEASSSIFDLLISDPTIGEELGLTVDFFFLGLLSENSGLFLKLSGLRAETILSFIFVGFLQSSKDLFSKLPEQLI